MLLAVTPACDDVAAGGGDAVVDLHGDDFHSRTADVYSIDPAGLCLPTSPTGLIEDDMPGVQVFGTGHLGAGSIRVVITGDVTVEFVAGTWLEPRAMARLDPKMPQRMMIAGNVLLEGPGEFLVDANCMEHQQSTPGKDSKFYSCTQEPTTPVQLCQRDCGDDQSCIWGCQQMQDAVATKYTDLRIVSLYIIDDCDDNYPLAFRFFDRTSGQAWPEEGIFKTVGVDIKTTTELTCTIGNRTLIPFFFLGPLLRSSQDVAVCRLQLVGRLRSPQLVTADLEVGMRRLPQSHRISGWGKSYDNPVVRKHRSHLLDGPDKVAVP